MTVIEGEPAQVRDLYINQWAMQGFQIERYQPAESWRVIADLQQEGDRITGRVRNETAYDLDDVSVVSGNRYVRLERIAAGSQIEVSHTLRGGTDGSPPFPYGLYEDALRSDAPGGISRQAMLKQNLLGSILEQGPGGVNLHPVSRSSPGWTRARSACRLTGAGAAHHHTTLLLVTQPFALTGDEIDIPPGFITPELVQTLNEFPCLRLRRKRLRRADGYGHTGLQLARSDPGPACHRTGSPGPVRRGNSGDLPAIALYDWQAAVWVALVGSRRGREPAGCGGAIRQSKQRGCAHAAEWQAGIGGR